MVSSFYVNMLALSSPADCKRKLQCFIRIFWYWQFVQKIAILVINAHALVVCYCAGVDPKSILCEFFKVGQCQKGFKCKFSHDLNVQRKGEKIDIYSDKRDGGK